ncbi:hypothetical protein C2845_PM16G06520 [Panicum miliaceum]|uniref:Uncharacterized protein n=1 Tax=Panicum miliaceum TaxID=4540 RepID=A0A3L6PUC0_PANMI|nr:hypothetical protein C2845_PM16G06520 [Panicum miliaceum]
MGAFIRGVANWEGQRKRPRRGHLGYLAHELRSARGRSAGGARVPAQAKLGRRGAELGLPPRKGSNGARWELGRNGAEPWQRRSGDWAAREG